MGGGRGQRKRRERLINSAHFFTDWIVKSCSNQFSLSKSEETYVIAVAFAEQEKANVVYIVPGRFTMCSEISRC